MLLFPIGSCYSYELNIATVNRVHLFIWHLRVPSKLYTVQFGKALRGHLPYAKEPRTAKITGNTVQAQAKIRVCEEHFRSADKFKVCHTFEFADIPDHAKYRLPSVPHLTGIIPSNQPTELNPQLRCRSYVEEF